MAKSKSKYRLWVTGFNPDRQLVDKSPLRFHFEEDTLYFETQSQLIEFFNNLDKVQEHFGRSMMTKYYINRVNQQQLVIPLIYIMAGFVMEDGQQIILQQHEIDVGGGKTAEEEQIEGQVDKNLEQLDEVIHNEKKEGKATKGKK